MSPQTEPAVGFVADLIFAEETAGVSQFASWIDLNWTFPERPAG